MIRALLFDEPVSLDTERDFWEHYIATFPDDSGGQPIGPSMRDYWGQYREQILPMWIAGKPGTRPSLWWTYDAPRLVNPPWYWQHFDLCEPRQRLGGVGDIHRGCGPEFDRGLPGPWLEGWETDADDIAADPNDPPLYEAQATYLRRHGLLEPGEEERLTESSFAPERVTLPPPIDDLVERSA